MNFRSRNKVAAEASMSSMTDLVFLLLIYFVILATQISPGINVDLPKTRPSHMPPMAAPCVVSVDADQQHYVATIAVTTDELEEAMRKELEKNPEKPTVLMRIDETVPTGVTVNILDICKRNEWKVGIATKSE
ncbi:MAG: ExbD/TolR family protein [Flavobacteriales bacterium]|nr:biopolymer transporter ExbD [Flavobacteriales bacterium]HCA83065.1 biopolymer transporter ExbD [Flavobacteriales bacterium]HRE75213.1 biopolymer transporter ExbD [Flavobacteriales bacterium]HRE97866.1 biopolymer transporter ExbD [Flavobacteriales bacterium]HRJ36028.1 biopolymer transporter ExbD [Flavobacteriales bacterium]